MKTILSIISIVLGVVGAIYVGVYLMFIRGIIQLVNSITPEIIAEGIAFGLIKIILASFVGWVIFVIGIGLAKVIAR